MLTVQSNAAMPEDERRAVQSYLGRPSRLASALTDGYFAPAIEAGAITREQATFLASTVFLMPIHVCLRTLGHQELEEGFVVTLRGRYRGDAAERAPVSRLEDPRVEMWHASAMTVCVEIEGERLTLDRDGIRRWARRVERVVWPEDTIDGILYTPELRAWRSDIAAVVPSLPMPHTVKLGPPAVAARRAALWGRDSLLDRRHTWATILLEDLAAGGHSVLEGLIAPGGHIRISPFAVPPDPARAETQEANIANYLRRLDEHLGTDRGAPIRTVGLLPHLAAPTEHDEEQADNETSGRQAALQALAARLPRQERRLCELLAEHKSYGLVARALKVKRSTVTRMAKRIRRKLRVSDPAV